MITLLDILQTIKMISTMNLPIDVVIKILRFDDRFRVRGGEIIDKLDKNKYKDIIHFLVNKPFPNFTYHVIGLREKSYAIALPKEIHIRYNLIFDAHDEIKEIEIYLWKKYQFLNKIICE